MRGYFSAVKEAFASNPDGNLEQLGVRTVKGRKREWQAVCCPCCADTNGSASISVETGYLVCHQCGREMDLFEWWREVRSLPDSWESCKDLGSRFHVEMPSTKQKKPGREPSIMTPDRLERAIMNLMESPEADWARKHFRDRGLWDPAVLAMHGIGFLQGGIIFAQWDPDGTLRKRYRIYTPAAKQKWHWSKGPGSPNGFWPYREISDSASILLCEGEMDVLAAWMQARTQRKSDQLVPFTWTGGATSPVASRAMPEEWRGRRVRIIYDNDTFQGPDVKTHRAPDPGKTRDMWRRRQNLVHGVARLFTQNQCQVELSAIPLDPIDCWGGDLRDWLKDREFSELPVWSITDLVDPEEDPVEIELREAAQHVGEFVTATGSVHSIMQFRTAIPRVVRIRCPMNSKPMCSNCGVSSGFSDQIMEGLLHRGDLLRAFLSPKPEEHLKKEVLGKPPNCTECRLEFEENWTGSVWQMTTEESQGLMHIPVVSTEEPSLAGDIQVTGYIGITDKGPGMFVTNLEQLDKPHFDVDLWDNDLRMLTPWASTDPDKIWGFLEDMASDYATHVTKIYGRPELHILTLLIAHSVLFYEIEGHAQRGWLDGCAFGVTRSGKSETIKRMLEWWGAGQHFTCMENFSRAGLTVGGGQAGQVMQPGLFPKNHGKMILLDEFHHMAMRGENPLIHLQSARDEGKISALKIYGNTKLNAAVRLICAGNWANRMRATFQFPCQHLLPLYGVPEALARLDFAWCTAEAKPGDIEDVPHVWRAELARALLFRAWAMMPSEVEFEAGVFDLAQETCNQWTEVFRTEELPLHTGAEKFYSILRTAISVANLCYSHPAGNPRRCLVRKAHVEVATSWIRKCWANLEYDRFSVQRTQALTIRQPFRVEGMVMCGLGLDDPETAHVVMSQLSEAQDMQSLAALMLGNGQIEEHRHFLTWCAQMRILCAMEGRREPKGVVFTPTPAFVEILQNLIRMAADDPDAYVHRYRVLETWFNSPAAKSRTPGIAEDPPLDRLGGEDESAGTPF